LRFELLEQEKVLVSYQCGAALNDAEWDSYIEVIRSRAHLQRDMRSCTFTEGVHPTREQYERLRKVSQGFVTKVALIGPPPPSAFTAAVFKLTNRHVRMFDVHEREAAFEHLGLTLAEVRAVEATHARLRSA
jgi:hypothetical protein